MGLIRKNNPKGVDCWIDFVQNKLYNHLTNVCGWSKWQSNHRAYINPRNGSNIPEVYDGNGEYKEVLYNDNFNITSFFLADDTAPEDNTGYIQRGVSLIVQMDINRTYPSVRHRADEEAHFDVRNALSKIPQVRDISLLVGQSNVYSEFGINGFDDMSDCHVFRFNMQASYTICKNKTNLY